ncbi:MAG: hypothetical protein WCJ45_05925 [bacterium]
MYATPTNPLISVATGAYMNGGVTGYVTSAGAITYMIRQPSSDRYSCPVGTYGNQPWMKVNIPAFTVPDTYS